MIHAMTVNGLSVSRGERRLFLGLDLELRGGEILALTGANGVGKTSLLRAIAGLLRPDAGEIRFFDGDANQLDPQSARGRQVHFLGHQDGLKTSRTARQELDFQCDWLGHTQYGHDHAVEAFGLAPLLDLEVRSLSAGQRRRLAMGRLVGSPRAVWLLDEPMAPLDRHWREVLAGQMRRHLDADGLIICAVHDPLPLACRTFDLGGLA